MPKLFHSSRNAGVVLNARDWLDSAGYEFWYNPGSADSITASGATNLSGLDSFGWTTTALGVTAGSSGSLLTSTDIDPTRIISDAGADLLVSPRIFGDYSGGLQAAEFMGVVPTRLSLKLYGRFATASANETTTFMGLNGPAVVDAAAAAGGGSIRSGGTASTFFLTSDAGSSAGAAIDTAYHTWEIIYGPSTTEWFQDGVSKGTITTELDIWPLSLVCFAGTTNRWELAWARVKYLP